MPVYLSTYHAYGTWLPDKEKGYMRRKRGLLPKNSDRADLYRSQMPSDPAIFDDKTQKILIEAVRSTQEHLDITIRLIATDASHVHILLQWPDNKPWDKIRASIKVKLSKELKLIDANRKWLSQGASRKQVKEDEHLHHLENEYLPDHLGWKWCFK